LLVTAQTIRNIFRKSEVLLRFYDPAVSTSHKAICNRQTSRRTDGLSAMHNATCISTLFYLMSGRHTNNSKKQSYKYKRTLQN